MRSNSFEIKLAKFSENCYRKYDNAKHSFSKSTQSYYECCEIQKSQDRMPECLLHLTDKETGLYASFAGSSSFKNLNSAGPLVVITPQPLSEDAVLELK